MTKPDALDLLHLLSAEARRRKPSPLKSAFKYFKVPGMSSLGGGLPLSDYFPYDYLSAHIPTPPFKNGIGAQITEADTTVVDVHRSAAKNGPKEIELARLLQYGYTEGQPELIEYLRTHTDLIHKVPYRDWLVICLIGNTQLWDACLRTFVAAGDAILVEAHSFSLALETAQAQGVHTVPVQMDADGVIPEVLAEQLELWVGPKPKIFYTICTGQNPTGLCITAARRRAIYQLAQKHDFIIVEDEPYYFLQMEKYTRDAASREGARVLLHDAFVEALVPLYLLMDVEGRVIRLDSVSKTLAPGARFGWIVGQERLMERFVRLHEVLIQCPSGFSQLMLNGLFQRWGQDGYLDWLIGLRAEYTHRRDVAIDALYKFAPLDVVTVVPPLAGMFFIVEIDALKHPKLTLPLDVEQAVYERALAEGCLMIPGSWFKAEGQTDPPQKEVAEVKPNVVFFRGTYASVPLDELEHGLEKFCRAVRLEFGLEGAK